jgi:hypothetical protein
MSNWQSRHPEEGVLLRYLDGELPSRKARPVRKHLEACWQCRAELEALEITVAECVRYRKNVLEAHLPEAPQPWMDLYRGFDRIDAEHSAEPFWKRLRPVPGAWAWSAAAVAAAAVILGVFLHLRVTPSAQAAVLLKRAVAAADARPAAPHRVRIRTRTQQVIRTPGIRRAAEAPMPEPITELFRRANYDTADPLSARAFESWRDSLQEKKDDVAVSPEAYEIHTSTSEGPLATATLKLRSADLRPVEGKLEFRDQDWIEFSEVLESPALDDGSPVVSPLGAPGRPAEPSRLAAVAPGNTASISDELEVLSVLHQIGADLGDPIDVKLESGRVVVGGVGVSSERQRQIHGLLDSLPHVEVAFSDPGPAGTPAPSQATAPGPAGGAGAVPPPPPPAGWQNRLEQQLGGRAAFERFSSRILDWNEAAMSRAYALRTLAQRFPAESETGLNAADRRALRGMALEHVRALGNDVRGIEGALAPILAGLGAQLPQAPAAGRFDAWQPAAQDLLREAQRVELLMSVLMGVAPAERAGGDVPSELRAALRDLSTGLERCQELLGQ